MTAARRGARYERAVMIYTAGGAELATLTRIATALPARYRAHREIGGVDRAAFVADAGKYVAVRGETAGEGGVRVVASTGCRPLGDRLPTDSVPGTADLTALRPLTDVLAALGARVDDRAVRVVRVPCPSGGTLRTLSATKPGTVDLAQLPARLTAAGWAPQQLPGEPGQGVAEQGRFAFRHDGAGAVVGSDQGTVSVALTTGCSP